MNEIDPNKYLDIINKNNKKCTDSKNNIKKILERPWNKNFDNCRYIFFHLLLCANITMTLKKLSLNMSLLM